MLFRYKLLCSPNGDVDVSDWGLRSILGCWAVTFCHILAIGILLPLTTGWPKVSLVSLGGFKATLLIIIHSLVFNLPDIGSIVLYLLILRRKNEVPIQDLTNGHLELNVGDCGGGSISSLQAAMEAQLRQAESENSKKERRAAIRALKSNLLTAFLDFVLAVAGLIPNLVLRSLFIIGMTSVCTSLLPLYVANRNLVLMRRGVEMARTQMVEFFQACCVRNFQVEPVDSERSSSSST